MHLDEIVAVRRRLEVDPRVPAHAGRVVAAGQIPAVGRADGEHGVDRGAQSSRLDLQDDPFPGLQRDAVEVPVRRAEGAVYDDRRLDRLRAALGVVSRRPGPLRFRLDRLGKRRHAEQPHVGEPVRRLHRQRVGAGLGVCSDLQQILPGRALGAELRHRPGDARMDLDLAVQPVALQLQADGRAPLAPRRRNAQQRRAGVDGQRRPQRKGGGRRQACSPIANGLGSKNTHWITPRRRLLRRRPRSRSAPRQRS